MRLVGKSLNQMIKAHDLFQFQIGAIGSQCGNDFGLDHASFNSRLVRLVVIEIDDIYELCASFNSRLVRLVV